MFNIVIVDDEIDAIEVVTKLIRNFTSLAVKICGTANNLETGLELIHKTKPDIVLLDIEMPGQNGLAIFDYFKEPDFKVIFITAYEKYAIEAIKKSASDYLLKPYNIIELRETLQKVIKQIEKERQLEVLQDRIKFLTNIEIDGHDIIIDVESGFVMENTGNIEYCYACQAYSTVVTNTKQEIVFTKSLAQLEQILPSTQFYRTHKSYLVNIHYIKKFIRAKESFLLMKSGIKIPVSVRKSVNIIAEIKQMIVK